MSAAAGLPDAYAFTCAVRSMTEQGRDAYLSQATPLYTRLALALTPAPYGGGGGGGGTGPTGNLYVGRRFAKREEAAQGWTHVYNVQTRSMRPSDVWYAEHLPRDCALELYTLPRSNDDGGATDKAIMKVVDHVVAAARHHQASLAPDGDPYGLSPPSLPPQDAVACGCTAIRAQAHQPLAVSKPQPLDARADFYRRGHGGLGSVLRC